MCNKKILIAKDCVCESSLHEITHYPRKGLELRTINKDTVCDFVSEWSNFYGSYVRVMHDGYRYDINPANLKKDIFGNIDFVME